MHGKSSPFAEYITWILKTYQEVQQQIKQQDFFRIVEVKNNKANERVLTIQIIGKATVFECTPQEIIQNDQLLEGFSKKDIRTITYYATQEMKEPKYRILIQEFKENLKETIFKLGKRGSDKPIEKTAAQISLDEELLNQLNSKDAHLIGYVAATESILKEKEKIKEMQERSMNTNLIKELIK